MNGYYDDGYMQITFGEWRETDDPKLPRYYRNVTIRVPSLPLPEELMVTVRVQYADNLFEALSL